MITVLHGENIASSRKVLTEKIKFFKEKGGEVIKLDGRKVGLTEIKQACEARSLFGSNKLVVIERFFSQPKSRQKAEIQNYFQYLSLEIDIIFWEEGKLTPSQLAKFPPQTKSYLFKVEPIIFKFLDSFSPENTRQSLSLLSQCNKVESPEMIFYMLCRQVRLLILAKDLERKGFAGMPFWMQNKFLNQSRHFSLEKLLETHRQLLKIDYEQKTGKAIMPLSFQLDLLVANL